MKKKNERNRRILIKRETLRELMKPADLMAVAGAQSQAPNTDVSNCCCGPPTGDCP